MTNPIYGNESLSNVHPVDALADVRAEIKALQARESFLRDKLISGGASLVGQSHEASITNHSVMRLDTQKLEKALGDLTPYKSENTLVMVRVKRLKQLSAAQI
jgi:hypothetical protein